MYLMLSIFTIFSLNRQVYVLPTLPTGRGIGGLSAKKKKKKIRLMLKKKERKKEMISFPLLRTFVFCHIYFRVKENEPEQKLIGG